MVDSNLINRDRHCAYCLKFLPAGTAKLCGKCHRRAYCSRECQTTDWNQGQRHKNWCHLGCGEEDIDWEIKPVEGKGLGIIAKRFIPANYRIIVDSPRDHDHPAIADLMPVGGSWDEKLQLNSFGFEADGNRKKHVYLRLARINHDCDPNTDQCNDPTYGASIIFSNRDIQEGHEITISYTMLTNVVDEHSDAHIDAFTDPMKSRMTLELSWGIKCRDDCFCRTADLENRLKKCFEMGRATKKPIRFHTNTALDHFLLVKQLLEDLETIRASWGTRMRTLYLAFQIGIMKRETMGEAINYVKRVEEMTAAVYHPNSENVRKFRNLVADPSQHHNYLLMEKFRL